MKRYRVDFYDMMDGWIGSNQHEFDDFEEAKKWAVMKRAMNYKEVKLLKVETNEIEF